jgi:hypothetical protein
MNNLVSYLQPIRRRLSVRFLIDRDADHRKSVFLAGTGRSGGGWIAETINQRNEYRYIFEPFHPKQAPWTKPFPARKYMRPDDDDPEFYALAQRIVTGRIRHPWTERFNTRFIVHQRLIKEDFGNLMMKWLHVRFPGMPLILLLRHPCAVALSYVTHGFQGAVGPLLDQKNLMEDFLHPYADEIRQARDTFERAIFLWCVETLVPLKQLRPDEVHVVFYENMVRDPEAEVGKLFAYLGKSAEGIDIDRLKRPSLTARKVSSAAWTGEDRVDAWRKKVTETERRRAQEIVARFGLDRIYGDGPMPNVQGACDVMNEGPRRRPVAASSDNTVVGRVISPAWSPNPESA